ncbi:MAG: thiamine pyrophosphate-binding protein [Verrucomicrobiaceae bacterium]|jgi:acetolactate synthase-1/2/3 large subunit|nr:thiamine pyrophosphate-binding protein [Verrucomicrobiaceae bacterium]
MSNSPLQKYSEALADWLVELGYTHCFMVAGGGCMHLIDGFRTRFKMVPVVHELSAGIAAEHFNECSSGGKAFALVTSGPGLTNIVTSIAGCYVERRELLVISGQVKSTDLLTYPIRQRGVQEIDGVAIAKEISVKSKCLKKVIGREEFCELVKSAWGPHPGPVVIEVCLDIQGAPVDRHSLDVESVPALPKVQLSCSTETEIHDQAQALAAVISQAKRPVILLGGLVTRAVAWELFPTFLQLGIPVMTTTFAIDRIPSDSAITAGRTGTWGGQRSANLLIAQADVILAFGTPLDLQQTGFNWKEYTPNGELYQVYPCLHELNKGHPTLAGTVHADPNILLKEILPLVQWRDQDNWLAYVQSTRRLLPVIEPANLLQNEYPSPFVVLNQLSLASQANDVLAIASSSAAFTGALQTYEIKQQQYATYSAAFASMGYGLATSVGAAFARPGQRVILIEGDGGFSQNLQELAMLKVNNLPIKIFLFDNLGYGSIRATQRKFFSGAYVGCDTQTGLGFPDWIKLFAAYDIPARYLRPDEITVANLSELMQGEEPEAWIISIDPEQPNWPAVSSRILPDGSIVSNPLYQMLPTIEEPVAAAVSKYIPKTV